MYNIENLFLFDGLSNIDKSDIVSSLTVSKSFAKGQTIYNADSFENALGIFLSGRAEAVSENVLKKNFIEGDTFGAASIFGAGEKYISEIITKTDCVVQFITEKELNEMFAKYPATSINYITFLSGRIRYLNQKIKLYTCKGAAAKLYLYLCSNADENNIVQITNMTSLARLTSIGRTSLYRAVEELCESGLIERKKSILNLWE
ncbi:MAG: Crp/Fnr family transcriptional regulator [Eubacterium sp.]